VRRFLISCTIYRTDGEDVAAIEEPSELHPAHIGRQHSPAILRPLLALPLLPVHTNASHSQGVIPHTQRAKLGGEGARERAAAIQLTHE